MTKHPPLEPEWSEWSECSECSEWSKWSQAGRQMGEEGSALAPSRCGWKRAGAKQVLPNQAGRPRGTDGRALAPRSVFGARAWVGVTVLAADNLPTLVP